VLDEGATTKRVMKNGRLIEQYRLLHAGMKYDSPNLDPKYQDLIREWADGPVSVIDYGCGRSSEIVTIFTETQCFFFYDPAIEELRELPDEIMMPCDVGFCSEVMEHIPEEELAANIELMKKLAPKWAITIHTRLASQILPNGENAHCTVHDAGWWEALFSNFFTSLVIHPINSYRFLLLAS